MCLSIETNLKTGLGISVGCDVAVAPIDRIVRYDVLAARDVRCGQLLLPSELATLIKCLELFLGDIVVEPLTNFVVVLDLGARAGLWGDCT